MYAVDSPPTVVFSSLPLHWRSPEEEPAEGTLCVMIGRRGGIHTGRFSQAGKWGWWSNGHWLTKQYIVAWIPKEELIATCPYLR